MFFIVKRACDDLYYCLFIPPTDQNIQPKQFCKLKVFCRAAGHPQEHSEERWEGGSLSDCSPHGSHTGRNYLKLTELLKKNPSIALCPLSLHVRWVTHRRRQPVTPCPTKGRGSWAVAAEPLHTQEGLFGVVEKGGKAASPMSLQRCRCAQTGTEAANISFLTAKGLLWETAVFFITSVLSTVTSCGVAAVMRFITGGSM